MKRDYIDVTYCDKPPFWFPHYLVSYLAARYQMKSGMKLLDVGSGRGEYLDNFLSLGIDAYGIDNAERAADFYDYDVDRVKIADISEKLPYKTHSFDVVFAKSICEHLYYPERLCDECYRVLKKGGQLITITPDWRTCYKTFFGDFQHRHPFTAEAMRDMLLVSGFDAVKVKSVVLMPEVLARPWLEVPYRIASHFAPKKSRLAQFAKGLMILASGRKR